MLHLDVLDQRGLALRLEPARRASGSTASAAHWNSALKCAHRLPMSTCAASCAAKSRYGTSTPHCLHRTCHRRWHHIHVRPLPAPRTDDELCCFSCRSSAVLDEKLEPQCRHKKDTSFCGALWQILRCLDSPVNVRNLQTRQTVAIQRRRGNRTCDRNSCTCATARCALCASAQTACPGWLHSS